MKKIQIKDKFEWINCEEQFLQLVEDNMVKDSREYIEENFNSSKCDKCLYVIDLENINEDLQWENDGLNKKIDEMQEELDSIDKDD